MGIFIQVGKLTQQADCFNQRRVMKNKNTTALLIIFVCFALVFILCGFTNTINVERYLYYKSVKKPTILQLEYIRNTEDLWKKKYFNK